ncbi:MAG TPA: hypothetical protein VEV17_14770 [Bryobacteraceae bacterium]|nr:hypothetical protein [Bryobacteraceae bacterium]
MSQIASVTTKKLLNVLATSPGVPEAVAALISADSLVLPAISVPQIVGQNVAADVAEKSISSKYPLIYVYCSKITNAQREKFRNFSGDAEMVVEARVSQDRLDGIESHLHAYVDAITQVLNAKRGDWGDGVFYTGGYEVSFAGVKHGGRNFIQIARVSFALEISAD